MSSEITYSSINITRSARDFEEKRMKERKAHIISLIIQYLRDEGHLESSICLANEVPTSKYYSVCDNVDISTILQEYENYYFLRFQKYPKICKKIVNSDIPEMQKKKGHIKHTVRAKSSNDFSCRKGEDVISNDDALPLTAIKAPQHLGCNQKSSAPLDLKLTVLPVGSLPKNLNTCQTELENNPKPLQILNNFSENLKDMAHEISKEIAWENPNVHWDDIIGHENAKQILKEAIEYPIHYPELFTGIMGPWKGLLLYGPPGTGKSLLAKAVATECNTTVISISPSTINSKWRGDSEKLIKVVFELARRNSPSTIFVEELDSLASRRDLPSEHEASRRLKTELFLQMDKLIHHNNSSQDDKVFFLATSNIPWEIDPAMLRRLEKRVLVDLPTVNERKQLFLYFLPPKMRKEWNGPALDCKLDYSELAKVTEGYSGSDIRLICKESLMERMRHVFSVLERNNSGGDQKPLHLPKLMTQNVREAISKTKPSASKESIKYKQWTDEYGSA